MANDKNMAFRYVIALGSNAQVADETPQDLVRKALLSLDEYPLNLLAKSRLYLTPFFPVGTGDDVVNAVAMIETSLSPQGLLAHLHDVEARFGRERKQRWGSRTLDLDLIMADDKVFPDTETVQYWIDLTPDEQKTRAPEGLILPHPRLQDRAFVLVPAVEVAAEWRHPLLGKSLKELLDALPKNEIAEIAPLE